MAVSKAQQKATAKYIKAHYDRIELQLHKGAREALKVHASTHDRSTSAFIVRAIRHALQDDGADPDTIRAICGD